VASLCVAVQKSFIEKKPQALKKLGKEGKNMMIRYRELLSLFSKAVARTLTRLEQIFVD
jgi:hypothetical protein